jgi:hypothetical protein
MYVTMCAKEPENSLLDLRGEFYVPGRLHSNLDKALLR